MEENSLGIAFVLICFHLVVYLNHKIIERKIKKDKAHYEAIADEHLKRMYNPLQGNFYTIILLVFGGFNLTNKELIIAYILWTTISSISLRQKFIINQLDILSLKNGLITMFCPDINAYCDCSSAEIKTSDYINNDGNKNDKYIRLEYYYKDKFIYEHSMSIENLSEEEIKNNIYWFSKRFKDYIRYIPKEIFEKENVYQEFDHWLAYLDDVRVNF